MNIRPRAAQARSQQTRAAFHIVTAFSLLLITAAGLSAQQKVSRRFPVGKNVRIELKNLSGTIIVESWPRDEIKITATMDSPAARFNPQQTESGVVIDLIGDNRGRADVGDVNFKIQVPARSSVDLETRRGQITVTNIQGDLVRAHVSTEGDIVLTDISAARVIASNTIGDIYFDGLFASGGTYEFKSGQGNITISIPANCGFRLVATAPAKKISMGDFWNKDMQFMGEGRKVIGDVGDGRASVTVTNYRGEIKFRRR